MIAARVFAALAFVGAVVLLLYANRRLREHARVEAADGLLRQAFEDLEEHGSPPHTSPREDPRSSC